MKLLLAAINAKYIHSNLGIYSLKRYGEKRLREAAGQSGFCPSVEVELGEYTINHQMERILEDIYRRRPDVVGFSCYIWNISFVKALVRDLKKVMPQVRIWLGGPEVSYDAKRTLRELPEAELVMMGEGEETLARLLLLERGREREGLLEIPGIAFRKEGGEIAVGSPSPLLSLDELPFPYEGLEGLENRIIYYESSRGCPFSCSYCLSSIDKSVRFRSLELVKRELSFFLERRVPQVKFVDRTFNCKKSHAMAIWRFLLENDNGVTNFHFEISADLLGEEELALMSRMRPGLIQLEIGVQTTNEDTIREIRRKMDLKRLSENVARINGFGNIHQHLDLIAGLPWEDLESFRLSFNQVYAMEPEQLQLGFLKVLKGSYMEERAGDYGLLYQSEPPYEVLSTKWLDYGGVIRLKAVEEMVEVYYNSGQFQNTMRALVKRQGEPFSLYESLAEYYERKKLRGISHSRLARYEILFQFLEERGVEGEELEHFRDLLMEDLYLRENVKSRPFFAGDPGRKKEEIKAFFRREEKCPRYLEGYEGYDSRQLMKMAHMEAMGDGSFLLFDYRNRDALLGNARMFRLTGEEMQAEEKPIRAGKNSRKQE